jgi:catechol 2,3-dioxygenase
MTGIQGHIKPQRRPGELGVHSLDHFHFVAPDLALAGSFYSEFGLEVAPEANGLALRTRGNPHTWGTIGEGPRKKHQFLSFGAFGDDIDGFAKRLDDMRIDRLDPPPGVDSNGLWLRDHDGNLVEIAVAPKTSPDEKSSFTLTPAGPGERAAPFRREVRRTYPRRLAHILMFTRDVTRAIDFYARVLGLRLSDHSGDGVAFLHGVHGSDHHLIAFAKSNAPGFHHLSWDVGGIEEIGVGAMHMLGKGHSRGWGLGRHVLGSNYFHYVGDPWGSFSEYSAGIDYVPADCDWPAADNDPEDSFYVWGPIRPRTSSTTTKPDRDVTRASWSPAAGTPL